MRKKRRRRVRGFGLLEIMVCLVIMAAMATAVAISVMNSRKTANIHATKGRARTIQNAVTHYLMAGGDEECPSVEELLRANILDTTTDPNDAWGNAFAIHCDESAVHVLSSGPDEVLGNDDDVGF